MRDYASTRSNIHLSEGDIPSVEIAIQKSSRSGADDVIVITISSVGHTAVYFLYKQPGQATDILLNRVISSLSNPVISYDH